MKRLEAVTGHTRLFRRGAVYYHRAAIPQDIKSTYPRTEETFSLKTKDYTEALRKVRLAAVEVDLRFSEHRQRMAHERATLLEVLTPAQIVDAKAAYSRHLLDEDEETRIAGFVDLDEDGKVVGAFPELPLPTFEEHGEIAKEWQQSTRHQYARGRGDAFWMAEIDEVLSWEGLGLRLSPASPSRQHLIRALQEATIEATQAIAQRQAGEIIPTPGAPSVPSAEAPLLSLKVAEWVAEKMRGHWSEKASDDYKHWLAVFIEINGDKPITHYSKSDGLRFKDVLTKLPANASKVKALHGLNTAEAAATAAEMGLAPVSVATYNKAMLRVGAFFKWAKPNVIEDIQNPVDGLRQKDPVRGRDKRDPIAAVNLTKLFSSPLWRSCRSERFCAQPGDVVLTSHWRYWLPLIGLWTGARSSEIGQLLVSDVNNENGVDYLHIIDDTEEKRVKTAAGRRKVPIHNQLKALGFMDYVADWRKQQPTGRLFPELQAGGYGYYSDTVSKFFSRYMDAINIKTDKTSFHSLRHNFQDACRHAKVFRGHREAIAGREEGGVGGGYGGESYDLVDLNASLQSIRYPSVDFTLLPRYIPQG